MTSLEIAPAPTRIVLYTENLLSLAEDDASLREEVETTVLHELGHFFGMEEEDLERIGLD
jgi:predicted Zn-dependent protease with MMP-like domain